MAVKLRLIPSWTPVTVTLNSASGALSANARSISSPTRCVFAFERKNCRVASLARMRHIGALGLSSGLAELVNS